MSETVGAKFQRDFSLALCDNGARHRRAEQIRVFVDGARAERRPDVVAHEFFAQILNGRARCSGCQRLFVRALQIFLLADVAYHGDHFAAVVIFLQPGNDDRRIESAGIGEHYFFRFRLLLFHVSPLCCE
jgi:hypothetical protein